MMDEHFSVPTDNHLLAAMVFLAALAYPEDVEARKRAGAGMHAFVSRCAKKAGALPQLPPGILTRQQQDGTMRRLASRIDKRLLAAAVCADLLASTRRLAGTRKVSPLDINETKFRLRNAGLSEESVTRHTLTNVSIAGNPYSLNDYARCSGTRFKSDAWAPEVMHLALALRSVGLRWSDPHGRPFGIATLLFNPQWVNKALNLAEVLAQNLPKTANLPASLRGLKFCHRVRLTPTE